MAGNEHETQEVVAHVVVALNAEIRHGHLLLELELASELFLFALESLVATQAVDRAMLRRRHEPGARVVRDA